jgi:hypothetical protein
MIVEEEKGACGVIVRGEQYQESSSSTLESAEYRRRRTN